MVTYEDFATGNVYIFLTNNLEYEALTIKEENALQSIVTHYFKEHRSVPD